MTTTGVRASFKSFDESTKEDWMAIMPQLQVTQSMVADRVLEQLGYLRNDYGGIPVARLAHPLQSATRAEPDGRAGAYLVRALLPGTGDTPAPLHPPTIPP